MFYEIIKELTKVRRNNSVFKEYGEEFCNLCSNYTKDCIDVKDKQLNTLKTIAKKLDVPVDFIISLLNYEGVEEIDKTRGTSEEASRSTKENILQQHD